MQALKSSLAERSRKTVNNVLAVLGKLLKVAVKWKLISKLPCTIELMKVSNLVVKFYEFGQYKRLVEAAARYDERSLVTVRPPRRRCRATHGRDPRLALVRRGLPAASDPSFSKPSGKASSTFRRAGTDASSP